MTDQRYEQAFADAFAHITAQPRPGFTVDVARLSAAPARRGVGLRRLAVAAAVLVVLGLVWAALRPVPLVGLPVAPVTEPVTVVDSAILGFDVDDSLPYESAQVTVSVADGRLHIELAATRRGAAARSVGSFTAPEGRYWSTVVDRDLAVAILPGRAADVISLSPFDTVQSAYLSTTGLTAVAVERDRDADFRGLIWREGDAFRDSLGTPVASAQVAVGGPVDPGTTRPSLTVLRDEGLGVWGWVDGASGDGTVRPLTSEPLGSLMELSATAGSGEDFTDVSWIGFLPAGGSDPSPAVASAGISWGSAPVGDSGRVAILVTARSIRKGDSPVTSVTYTDAAGQRVTYIPGLR